MKAVIVSQDREIQQMCREMLGESEGEPWKIVSVADEPTQLDFDLYIWDYQPDLIGSEYELTDTPQKHLFLVRRTDLNSFRERNLPNANIILKPITRAAFKAFVAEPRRDPIVGPSFGRLCNERNDIFQLLLQANLNLQEYDQERTNFLARAVHDFCSPLTAISGYCGLLNSEQLGAVNKDQREVLKRMQQSAKRLSRLTSAMLQLSVGRRVNRAPNMRAGDIRDCVDQTLHELGPLIEEKKLDVSVDIDPVPEVLHFEESQIEQVTSNLLDNACRFTPRRGRIEIKGYPFFWDQLDRRTGHMNTPNSFRIDILDSGPGIPQEHLKLVFEEYTSYSAGQGRTSAGLGLAICKLIMSQHYGDVWAESTSAGATFSFVLPFHESTVQSDRPLLSERAVAGIGAD
jgi:signal transduction histidine kinase